MQFLPSLLAFLIENKEILIGALVNMVALAKLSAWGRAKGNALDAVVEVIERIGAKDVKDAVAGKEYELNVATRDALTQAVAKADPGKQPDGPLSVITREVLRGIISRK